MQIYTGTSGFSYKEWKGKFYPEKLSQKNFLSYYADRFDTVEINATFYRMPKESVLVDWGDQVPERFRFVLKTSRRITHRKAFDEEPDLTDYFLKTSSVLGQRMGPTLAQLPPFSRKDAVRLGRFFDQFPKRWRLAMEFRHQSWYDDEIFELMRERGVCLVHVDADDSKVRSDLTPTTDWGYLRLRGQDYGDDDLRRWTDAVRDQGWKEAYIFFKHEDEAAGPHMAQRFMEIVS